MIKLTQFTKANWMCYQGAEGLRCFNQPENVVTMNDKYAPLIAQIKVDGVEADVIVGLQGIEIYKNSTQPIMYNLASTPEASALVLFYLEENTTSEKLYELGFISEPC